MIDRICTTSDLGAARGGAGGPAEVFARGAVPCGVWSAAAALVARRCARAFRAVRRAAPAAPAPSAAQQPPHGHEKAESSEQVNEPTSSTRGRSCRGTSKPARRHEVTTAASAPAAATAAAAGRAAAAATARAAGRAAPPAARAGASAAATGPATAAARAARARRRLRRRGRRRRRRVVGSSRRRGSGRSRGRAARCTSPAQTRASRSTSCQRAPAPHDGVSGGGAGGAECSQQPSHGHEIEWSSAHVKKPPSSQLAHERPRHIPPPLLHESLRSAR